MKITHTVLLALSAAQTALSAPAFIQDRQFDGSDTLNQVTDSTPCRPVTVIYARGTGAPGNVGNSGDVGPVFFNGLANRLGIPQVAVQGVNYDAHIGGFLIGGDPAGTESMVALASQAASDCLGTQIVLVGYSQGAQVTHNAANELSTSLASRVAAVVTFGDPKNSEGFGNIPSSRTRIYCRTGDNICDGGLDAGGEHGKYQLNVPDAVTFVAGLV